MTNTSGEGSGLRAGRRRLYGDQLAQTRSLSLDPDNWTWLDGQATATGRTRSNVLNRILDDHRRASTITPDHTEPEQRRMISVDGSTIVPPDAKQTAKHEWDPTGVRCVRCGELKRKDLNGRCAL